VSAPLPRPVKVLGAVSLLTDASSEMIYPLLPAFLTGALRAGPLFLGLVEGAAEAAASLLKLASGWLSDRWARRKPLVVAGYTLSSLARPLVAVAGSPWHVLAIRLADRAGKGARGAPRDAWLAEVTPAGVRGRAYGFHRAMDHAGAVVGPLLASALLWLGLELRGVFALAAVPALLSVVVLIAGTREAPRERALTTDAGAVSREKLPGAFRRYLAVVGLFTLGNSSDAFLILRAQDAGVGLAAIPLLWTFHHLVKAAASTAGGALSDRAGRKSTIAAGWAVYAASYAGFALATSAWQAWALFGLYGLYHALTEGPERALVADLAGASARGRAFGLFHAVTGGMLLPASLVTGWLWQAYGPPLALAAGAGLACAAALGLALAVPAPGHAEPARR
jgi:MFS family permease